MLFSLGILLVLVALCFGVFMFRGLTGKGIFEYPRRPLSRFGIHRNRMPLSAQVDYIREWMTFDYINKVFNLPSDYLKNQLGITDARYPRITVLQAAAGMHKPLDALVAQLKDAVLRRIAPVNSP